MYKRQVVDDQRLARVVDLKIDKISKVSKRIDQKHLYEQDDDEQP